MEAVLREFDDHESGCVVGLGYRSSGAWTMGRGTGENN
jgi:hypothetical protein